MLIAQRREMDPEKRKRIVHGIQRYLADKAYYVYIPMGLGNLILVEASLSFLGFGVPPPHPTWGGMLSLQGLSYMYQAPWLAIWPGVALSAAVFGFNMFGDALTGSTGPASARRYIGLPKHFFAPVLSGEHPLEPLSLLWLHAFMKR